MTNGLWLVRNGSRVRVTARALAVAENRDEWEIMTPELQRRLVKEAQRRIDAFLAPLVEGR